MAEITLDTVWLSNAEDLTDSLAVQTLASLVITPTASGEVRQYANGRYRGITRAGTQLQAQFTSAHAGRTEVDWFTDHAGVLLLFRDPLGRSFYGTYYAPAITEHALELTADIAVTLLQVTRDDSV